jgi:cbb3-type cytochrome oxidase subunit 3
MKQEILKHFDLTFLPITALVLFVVCFALYTWWTFRAENRSGYEAASRLPLEDEMMSQTQKANL